jgi:Skp family chaperone for outer membrane proteins
VAALAGKSRRESKKEFRMIVRNLALMVGVLLVAIAGCGRENVPQAAASAPKSIGGVGVVDLDLVAKQLGRDVQMENDAKECLTTLNTKLTKLKSTLDQLYDDKQASFGVEPDDTQKKQLLSMQDMHNSQLIGEKRKAEAELSFYKQKLVDQFREQTKPVLKEVAAARGLSIVIPKNNGLLLTIDPGVEITDEVARRMLASQAPSPESKSKSKPAASKPRHSESTDTSAR